MKYVVVDLEMNAISREYNVPRRYGRQEIIEIGAVALDEKYNEIDSFATYVKPQYNDHIGKIYEQLTGITTEMVADAPAFAEALGAFFRWCESLGDQLQFCQWSTSDCAQIKKEMAMKNYTPTEQEKELLTGWIDVQREYGEMLDMAQRVSLENALFYAGIDFEGRQHDALFDARNTAVLLETVRNEDKRKLHYDKIIEVMKPSSSASCTLGDLFDLKAMLQACQEEESGSKAEA